MGTMPVLIEAIGPEEDWSGLKDAKERRKLQNRLNVRAHRRRKALLAGAEAEGSTCPDEARHQPTSLVLQDSYPDDSGRENRHRTNSLIAESSWSRLSYILDASYRGQTVIFPLSSDHLIPLVQYNFIRGVLTNMAILGCQRAFPPECARYWVNMPLFPAPSTVPESLQPTALQRSTPHEPWIDLIPDKQMRDNAIIAMGTFTREDVEENVTSSISGKPTLLEMNGILAWDEPWRVDGWELTEEFIKSWPFLVKGCWQMLESTNRWRAIRGEEPLVVEL
ncbi:hypothetical protein F4677DRAFT_424434 [Hypoxylon crocopeplum]|nr:hypothetical protein F4677DRAFT_424434 [Hypoxylon crocopeplum]